MIRQHGLLINVSSILLFLFPRFFSVSIHALQSIRNIQFRSKRQSYLALSGDSSPESWLDARENMTAWSVPNAPSIDTSSIHEAIDTSKAAVTATTKPTTTTAKSRIKSSDGTTYTAKYLADNGLELLDDGFGRITARPLPVIEQLEKNTTENFREPIHKQQQQQQHMKEHMPTAIPSTGFNVILTHCTADFDSLASAVGLAKVWEREEANKSRNDQSSFVPTFIVLPRGAHPGVQRFLGLHKHLFPIRSLKSLSDHFANVRKVALVDAQRRDRLGPAEPLLNFAKHITVVDHHVDQESDIPADEYVVENVGSVSTMMVERIQKTGISLSEAEATLLALGIHADTGNLCFDSTTYRDAAALSWCMREGASQAAIAEHAQSSLSPEQQGVLTQALVNVNTTVFQGVTVSTVLLSSDGFINGLAAVAQDALELSSSDIFLLSLVYQAKSGSKTRKGKKSKGLLTTQLLSKDVVNNETKDEAASILYAEGWQGGGEDSVRRRRLRAAFDRTDTDGSGFLESNEVAASLASAGVIVLENTVDDLFRAIDVDGNGKIDFEEFYLFALEAEKRQKENNDRLGRKGTTMIIIGRAKAGVSMKHVKLNNLLAQFGGGGHPKAASATVRLNHDAEAGEIMQSLVDELIETSLRGQPTVADFMTAPVLSVRPHMTVKQVEDLFTRYDVRALPVVDDDNEVIGLVSYQLVAAAKQRLWNKEQKRLRQEQDAREKGHPLPQIDDKVAAERRQGASVKAWMLQHVQIVEVSKTMAEVESILLENDVGCIPVVADGTRKLVGMVTRTDLLRQHRYYPSLPYHNKGFADSIAARKPIIELRKKLKKFDLD